VIVGALRESILDTIARARPTLGDLAREITLQRHADILAAIRAGDGPRACYLSRLSLVLTYGPLVGEPGRSRLEAMLESGPVPADRSEDWILGPGQSRPSAPAGAKPPSRRAASRKPKR